MRVGQSSTLRQRTSPLGATSLNEVAVFPVPGAAEVAVSAVTIGAQISWLSAVGNLVDGAAAAHLSAALRCQREIGCRFVWLDLSQVPMLDRASFEVLVEAHSRFQAAGGMLVLTGVGPRIARLLEITGQRETLFTVVAEPAPHQRPAGRDALGGEETRDESADRQMATASLTVQRRRTIDRAVGVVMGRTHCGIVEATEQLLVVGRATSRDVYEVAQSILDETTKARVERRAW